MIVPQTEIVVTVGGSEVARTTVKPGDYVIGSGGGADIVIVGDQISERHAQLIVNYHEIFIESIEGAGCTFVAGRLVTECTRLWPNQKVQIGPAILEARRIKEKSDSDESLPPETALVRHVLPAEFLGERKYQIGGVVAQGGMGAILDAHEAATGRTVAMKVMLPNMSEADVRRFIGEAKVTAQLEHPNIIPVHELGVDEHDQVFYTMKFVQGITLRKVLELLRAGTPETIAKYPLAELLTVFQKVCDAIAFAHSKDVLHRDLKPENIMLGGFGEVLVMDWGLAKIVAAGDEMPDADHAEPPQLGESGTHTMTGTVLGTPQFMSPEQARGEVESLDERTDIYSLGAILYQILALRPPVTGDDSAAVMKNVKAGKITPLDCAHAAGLHLPGGRIPESLAAVAMKALALDRDARYAGVPELQGEIARYQGGFATTAEHAGLRKQLVLFLKRHKTVAAAAALLFVVINAALVNVLLAGRRAAVERDRTNAALADLRGTAPTFIAQARAFFAEQKPDDALEKIGFALRLVPDDADYHLLHAHKLEALGRLPEAVAAYRRVLALRPGDESATANLALCERLDPAPGGAPLSTAARVTLLEAVKAERRTEDLWPLQRATGHESEAVKALLEVRLKALTALPSWQTPADKPRIADNGDGTFAVDLSKLPVSDLSMLAGLPVSFLAIAECPVSDLSPLAGLPLRKLHIMETEVADLRPLAHAPLENFDARGCPIEDLRPLQGRPLTYLDISATKVRDLSPLHGTPLKWLSVVHTPLEKLDALAGMPLTSLKVGDCPKLRDITALAGLPLEELDLSGCPSITDLSPLLKCPNLQRLLIPKDCRDLESVRRLPQLKQLADVSLADFQWSWAKVPPAETALRSIAESRTQRDTQSVRHEKLQEALRRVGLREGSLAAANLGPNGTLDVNIKSLAVADFSFLAEFPELRRLEMVDTPVRDLSPLAKLSLDLLNIAGTKVSDLTPLRGSPLRVLICDRCPNLRDVSALAGCAELESLIIPENVTGIEALRKLPKLKFIGTKWIGNEGRAVPPAAEFWAAFDRRGTVQGKLESLRAALRKAGASDQQIARVSLSADGTLDLDLVNVPVTDLAFLAGLPVKKLDMRLSKVSDLSGLRGAPLVWLEAWRCPIRDLTPLAECPALTFLGIGETQVSDLRPVLGLKLTELHLDGKTPVRDVAALAACVTLEHVTLPPNASGVEALRALPRLQRISFAWDNPKNRVAQSAAEFWAEFDRKKKP